MLHFAYQLVFMFSQSSAPVELTVAETEYSVNIDTVKHIYDGLSTTAQTPSSKNSYWKWQSSYFWAMLLRWFFYIREFYYSFFKKNIFLRLPFLSMHLKHKNFQKLQHQSHYDAYLMTHQGRLLLLSKSHYMHSFY